MNKRPNASSTSNDDVYARLSATTSVRAAKTLFLKVETMEALSERCEKINLEIERWNKQNLALPVAVREPKRRKIKPCDVIDDLIERHLRGEI